MKYVSLHFNISLGEGMNSGLPMAMFFKVGFWRFFIQECLHIMYIVILYGSLCEEKNTLLNPFLVFARDVKIADKDWRKCGESDILRILEAYIESNLLSIRQGMLL